MMGHQLPSYRSLRLIYFIPGFIWWGFSFWLLTMPGSSIPRFPWLAKIHADKIVHIAIFAGWCWLFCFPFRKSTFNSVQRMQWFLLIAVAGLLYGIVIEYLQLNMNRGRAFEISDVLADAAGCVIGFWAAKKFFGQ